MKKNIALLLAAIMTVSSLPVTAMASTKNTVSKIPTVEDGTEFDTNIFIDEFKGIASGEEHQTIKLTLTNAEFTGKQFGGSEDIKGEGTATAVYKEYTGDVTTVYEELTDQGTIGALKGYNAKGEDVSTLEGPEDDKTIVYYSADEGTTKYLKDDDSGKYYLAEDKEGTLEKVIKGYTDSEGKVVTLKDGKYYYDEITGYVDEDGNKVDKDGYRVDDSGDRLTTNTINGVEYTRISDDVAMAEFDVNDPDIPVILQLFCEATGDGDATVTIENVDSVVSSQTLKIANVADGSTTVTISDTSSITESGTKINSVVFTETTAGTLEEGTLRLRLTNGFKFLDKEPDIVVFPTSNGSLKVEFDKFDNDGQDALFKVTGTSTTAATISFSNLYVAYDDDDVEVGDECEMTISGAGVSKETIAIGDSADYGMSFEAEDEDLPVFYSGTYDEDVETLEVTIKENIANSWLENRKTNIIFPEGVEPISVEIGDTKNCNISEDDFDFDENEVTISGVTRGNDKDKMEVDLKFTLSVSPEFTGDITATLSGSAVGDDIEATVGEAVFPVTVDAETSELHIDYRETEASDIVITEADAGALKKGTTVTLAIEAVFPVTVDAETSELHIDYRETEASDIVITEADAGALKKGTTVTLAIDGISFDTTPTVEVTEGDMKIENVKVKDDTIRFDIKTESQKEPAEITISDITLYMDRNLPSGEYDLMLVASDEATNKNGTFDLSDDAIIRNYGSDTDQQGIFDVDEVVVKEDYVDVVTSGRDQGDNTFTTEIVAIIRNYGSDTDQQGIFDVDEVVVKEDYVDVVTSGRDQGDNTFTTEIVVPIGEYTIYSNGKPIEVDTPAYISNGYTMMPVRAVTEALSGTAIVRWDDPTDTVTIQMGSRVISMTVGSKVMNINGVEVAMQAECEITNSRAFIPLRDLGYALGLSDDKIVWDDSTKVATLNPKDK